MQTESNQTAALATGAKALCQILKRLSERGASLEPVDLANGECRYRLVSLRARAGAEPDLVSADLVGDALRRGWIAHRDGRCCLTAAGAAWVRRQLASGDQFRAQHQQLVARPLDEPRGPALINDAESPLGWLARRKDKSGVALITAAQFDAGERLRADFTFAHMMPRVTASWDPAGGGGRRSGSAPGAGCELRDNVVAAKERVKRALRAVGPELSGILVDVCCHLKGLEDVEHRHGWPQRSAKLILQLALTALARHYRSIARANVDARQ